MMFEPTQEDSLAYNDAGMSNVSLLEEDEDGGERAGLVTSSSSSSDSGSGSTAPRRVERHMTLREKLENLKQQAAARFESITRSGSAPAQSQTEAEGRFTYQEIQKAVEETVVKMTDPLYRDLDLESTLTFVDDIKSWSGGMPQMLPIVVHTIEKRLLDDDPNVSFLTLCLLDALVKNTTQRFHTTVATNPLMSTIARIARGNAHKAKTFSGDLRRDSKMMWQRLSSSGSQSVPDLDTQARERSSRASISKAKEAIKQWGEGFVQTQAALPLFASTYQTLLNEGMDFSDVNVEGAVVLDAPDEFNQFSQAGNSPDMSELSDSAHQTAKLLSEVCSNGGDESGLVEILIDQCVAQQAQLASHIEIAMASGDEAQMISALAANEALQEALSTAKGERGSGFSVTAATSTSATSEFDSMMGDVDSLLFDDNTDNAAAAAPLDSVDLLDLDFLSPAAAPAPTAAAPSIATVVAPPSFPPPASIPAIAPIAPPAAPASAPLAAPPSLTTSNVPGNPFADDDDELEDEFAGLALQRKQKGNNRLQEL